MPSVDITHQPTVVEATSDTSVVSFSETQVTVEVPNPTPVVEFSSAATLVPGAGLTGGGYLLGNVAIGLSAASVASLLKADTAVQPGANLSGFVDDVGLATDAEVAAAIAGLSAVYQPVNSNLTAIAGQSTTVFGRSFLDLADAVAARTLIGVYSTSQVYTKSEVNALVAAGLIPVWGTITGSILDQGDLQLALSAKSSIGHAHTWGEITGKPTTFTPSAHVHAAADITSGVIAPARLGTGTADATTYLRGDGTWATVSTTGYLPLTGGTVTGLLVAAVGAETLQLKAGATQDHVYVGFYADSQAQSTRSAYFGYGGGGGNTLSLVNEMTGGTLVFGTSGTSRMTISSDGIVNVLGALRVSGTDVSVAGHTHAYLPLAGGTMTGSIVLNYHTLFGNNTPGDTFTYDGDVIPHYGLRWYSDTEFEASGPTAALTSYGGIRFFTLGTMRAFISPGGDLATNRIYPITNNAYTLGSPSYYWSAVYGISFVENGTALASKYAAIGHTHTGLQSLTSPFHSGSDFPTGTLVATDIDGTPNDGASFVVEITGKSYSSVNPPFKVVIQGYYYGGAIIAASALSYGGAFASSVKLMTDAGVLKIWWPTISYWNSFNVRAYYATSATDGNVSRNRVTSITDAAEPTGSKKISVTVQQSLYTWGGVLTSGLNIQTAGSHITFYETDGPDPNDRGILEVNGGVFNIYTHDSSANAWYQPLSANISNANVWVGDGAAGTVTLRGIAVSIASQVYFGSKLHLQNNVLSFGYNGVLNANSLPITDEYATLRWTHATSISGGSSNVPPTPNNANGVLSLGKHTGGYTSQLFFADDLYIWHRNQSNGTWTSWYKVFTQANLADAWNDMLDANHGAYTDFNAIGRFGPIYIQSTTNGPGTPSATQYYSWSQGLGANYPFSQYAVQFAIPRVPLGGHPVLSVRFREGGTWAAWGGIAATALRVGSGGISVDNGTQWRVTTAYGYGDIGPANSGYFHFSTDRAAFYFGNRVEFGGGAKAYNSNVYFDANGFYVDSSNSRYFANTNGSYGTAMLNGSSGGYAGIRFNTAYGAPYLMFGTGGSNHGVYSESLSWLWYHNAGYFWTASSLYIVPRCGWATGGSSGSAHFSRGTAAPSGGSDGDVYFQYT